MALSAGRGDFGVVGEVSADAKPFQRLTDDFVYEVETHVEMERCALDELHGGVDEDVGVARCCSQSVKRALNLDRTNLDCRVRYFTGMGASRGNPRRHPAEVDWVMLRHERTFNAEGFGVPRGARGRRGHRLLRLSQCQRASGRHDYRLH